MSKDRHGSDQDNSSEISDEVLVERTRGGRLGTFDQLYERHAPAAWRTALAVTGNVHDAADAVAEAFSRVLRAVPAGQLDDPACFRPYLLTATRHSALDILRRNARVRPMGDMTTLDRPVTAKGPSEQLMASADASMVATAFAALPERWRTVLWLTEVEGVAPSDAASVLHTSPNAVAQLGVRARAGLRQQFIQAHLRSDAAEGCRSTVKVLGPYAAGSLTAKATARVDGHLVNCSACAERLAELNDLCTNLRRVIVPAIPATLAAWAAARSKLAGHAALAGSRHAGIAASRHAGIVASRHGVFSALPVITAKPLVGAALGIIGVGIIGASVMGQSFAPMPQAQPSPNLAGAAPPNHVRHIGPLDVPTSPGPSGFPGSAASPTGPTALTNLAAVAGPVSALPGPGANGAVASASMDNGSMAKGLPAAAPSMSAVVASTGLPSSGSPAQTTPRSDPSQGGQVTQGSPNASGAHTPSPSTPSPTTTSPPASRTPVLQVAANMPVATAPVSASVGVGPASCTGVGVASVHLGCPQPASTQPSVNLTGSLVNGVSSGLGLLH